LIGGRWKCSNAWSLAILIDRVLIKKVRHRREHKSPEPPAPLRRLAQKTLCRFYNIEYKIHVQFVAKTVPPRASVRGGDVLHYGCLLADANSGRPAVRQSRSFSRLQSNSDIPVFRAAGPHPFPFRTRSLSQSAPMILRCMSLGK
jgi:hypothetical protein